MTEETTAQTGDATGTNSGAVKVEFTPEQQAVIDRAIADRLKRAEEQWTAKQQAAQAQAKEEAEKEQLEKNSEYKTLYEKEKKTATDLYTQTIAASQKLAVLTQYEETITEMLTVQVEALGPAAKTAIDNLPGDPDALAKLRWLNANKGLFTKATDTKQPTGTPPRNRGLTYQPQQPNQPPAQSAPLIKL
jgi:small-conductance mechanosensitive channel